MEGLYPWVVLAQVERVRAMLDLSQGTTGAMYARVPFFADLRRAAGLPYFVRGPKPVNEKMLRTLLASNRAVELADVGYAGLVAILWLMLLKPF